MEKPTARLCGPRVVCTAVLPLLLKDCVGEGTEPATGDYTTSDDAADGGMSDRTV